MEINKRRGKMHKKNKTSGFVKSPLMQMNTINIVTDQKGTLLGEVEKIIRNGYEIKVLEIEINKR